MAPPTVNELDLFEDESHENLQGYGTVNVGRALSASSASSSSGHGSNRRITPNLKRKPHTKSRGGCFNCKARKIKCQETRPACENCKGKDMTCTYPTLAEQKIKRNRDDGSLVPLRPQEMITMQATPTMFTLTDMRLFHHFLTTAYPHLPLGNEVIWRTEIPIFAHQREYLMHAVLALGASHLSRLVPDGQQYTQLSLAHQNIAVRGFQQALGESARAYGDHDALLATCYALCFQASYMDDGLVDFLTMVRGCALVHEQIMREGGTTAFRLGDDWQQRIMSPWLDHLPPVDPSFLQEAQASLEVLQPMIRSPGELAFFRALHNTVTALMVSPRKGYEAFITIYSTWYSMDHAEFGNFVDPRNLIGRLLQTHFIAIQAIMIPLTEHEWPDHLEKHPRCMFGMLNWGETIWDGLPDEMKHLISWPVTILRKVRAEIEGKDFSRVRILRLKRRLSYGSDMPGTPYSIDWPRPLESTDVCTCPPCLATDGITFHCMQYTTNVAYNSADLSDFSDFSAFTG